MKKFIIFIVSIILFSCLTLSVSADCSLCTINQGPPSILTDYIKTVFTIKDRAQGQLKKVAPAENDVDAALYKLAAGIRAISIPGYRDSESDFNFYSQLTSTRPSQIDRDYKMLVDVHNVLINTLRQNTKLGYSSSRIKNICEGIDNCRYNDDVEYMALMLQLISNHQKLMRNFMISGQNQSVSYGLELVPSDFDIQMNKYYNADSIQACSECKDSNTKGFASEIKEKFDNIGDNMNGSNEARRRWKNAWDLLKGIDTPTKESQEQQILNSYLMTNGLNISQREQVLENLTNFNKYGNYSTSNNPLFNSASYTVSEAKKDIDVYKAVFYNRPEAPSISPASIKKDEDSLKQSSYIEQNIANIYKTGELLGANQDINNNESVQKLSQIHITLTSSIRLLEKNCSKARNVCETQSPGEGKCDYSCPY